MDFATDSLIAIHGLQSKNGQLMNSCFAQVLAHDDASGRVGVLIYSETCQRTGDQIPTRVAPREALLKPANLTAHTDSCPVFYLYSQTRAQALMQRGQLQQALPFLEQLTNKNPDKFGALQTYAVVLREIGQVPRAIEIMRRSLAAWPVADPQRANVMYDLGNALCKDGQLEESFEIAKTIGSCNTTNETQGITVCAELSNQTGMDTSPNGLRIGLIRIVANHFKKKKDFLSQIRVLFALVEYIPSDSIGRGRSNDYWELGAALCQTGQFRSGIAHYEKVLQIGLLEGLDSDNVKKALELAKKQLEGQMSNQPVVGVLADGSTINLIEGSVLVGQIDSDGSLVNAEVVVAGDDAPAAPPC